MSLDLIILSKNYEKFNTLYRDRGATDLHLVDEKW